MSIREEVDYSGLDALVWNGSVEAADVFVEELEKTSIGQQLLPAGLLTPTNTEKILDYARRAFGEEDPTFKQFCAAAKTLFLAGDLEPDPAPVVKPKELTASQKAWQEYRIFSETHSSLECELRAKNDEGYASFRHKNLEREVANTPSSQFKILNGKAPLTKEAIPVEVFSFAEAWKIMPIAQARALLSPAAAGAIKAARNQRIFDEACRLGLL